MERGEGAISRGYLIRELACVDQPTYEFQATVLFDSQELLPFIAFFAKLAQSLHFSFSKPSSAQNFTIFLPVHMALLFSL
jgi:hypothetical protein